MGLSDFEKITNFPSGKYSVTGFWIVLERKMTSHLLQMIMPSAMFVIVSWISFLMPLDSGERASLLVTVLLVLVSMFLSGESYFIQKHTSDLVQHLPTHILEKLDSGLEIVPTVRRSHSGTIGFLWSETRVL